ncbi:bifunctional methylenetetrahydrofolate dehydrogenase/methenyltetrahydrofolate cyclohydrolase FolD [Helicobacter zhangjianzhongii]|uniref:Bifunctional methylenetetrahydrofolate dehydrogenase/methenyltetrahydrofolate cyclohydrolase FolD n=1 Tax=Helicobacter zhangjianzhongii TaxID=2974574 RepID=A0ACC6FSU3_9HELI|nr:MULTISPECIES: bifunctional methylenetetrahydrofolate dehydrogenase/methenyltetrahydrofolate cyclohydrolase FolD [unclassified Helicobacter]MDL0079920.1 bifunctional methylenetetrahydrofolate dehydrogenase/methenyltetrahydrofolate cyclohydrolase FolD [Helicobacter sp. CPD2-1]MDL0081983.1 bifunctional methylenetetrahydrofolate dehydrogenase/methenyltetrahydrofolate cyclohydrolase FolD [Helicobacter sp. XJK30-2]
MTLLDGKSLSAHIQATIQSQVMSLPRAPKLVVILVGNDAPSLAYVTMKAKACKNVGIDGSVLNLPESTQESELLAHIRTLNTDDNVDGILVQLPLPKHIDTAKILESITPEKDVDGFHPLNVGRIQTNTQMDSSFAPATPLGVMRLLEHYKIDPKGKNVAIIGASNIVGKPLAALMHNANATISLCHIYTQDLSLYTKRADIVCVGVGKQNLLRAEMIQEGAVVIDIGINRLESGKLVGDVDFDNVAKKASFITPVPGGVGPMTIASLLENTLKAYRLRTLSQQ